MQLTPEQYQRYARHIVLPQIGPEGQQKLLEARVLLVGTGGLGSAVALYLAAAGVGRLGLVDFDRVDVTNLQRQVLHCEPNVGKPKLDSACERLRALNSGVELVPHAEALSSANAMEILSGYDILIDGTDNFPTRYLTNDACVFQGKPNVYGAISQFSGQASVFCTAGGPCYRCLFPEPPAPGTVPTCAQAGVFGIVPGVIGLIQATETLKLILGLGDSLAGRLLLYDALGMEFRSIKVRRNPDCPVCGDNPTIRRLIDYEGFCSAGHPAPVEEVTCDQLRRKLAEEPDLVLIDVRSAHEHRSGCIEGSRLVPLELLERRLEELLALRQKTLVVYCQLGGRSLQACQRLRQAGFRRVLNLRGGFLEWMRAGN